MAQSVRETHPLLAELAEAHGIATEFWDWQGAHTQVPAHTIVKVLAALDVEADTDEACTVALYEAEKRRWTRLVEPVIVTEQGAARTFEAHVRSGAPAQVSVKLEDGGTWPLAPAHNDAPDKEFDGVTYGEASFVLPPDLPLGYHRIQVVSEERFGEAQLIVSPTWVGLPPRLGERPVWGYAAQFYSTRSAQSWGIGDFVDLADMATWAKTRHNASFVLVNPVHAAEPMAPMEPSPYLPTSRRYLNPLYVRPEAIPEYNDLSDKKRAKIAALKKDAAPKRSAPQLDRNRAWAAKTRALRMVFSAGLRPARQMAFDDFRRREGRSLTHFATWCALASELGPNWRSWPAEYQRPSSPEVAEFAERHGKRIRFYSWLQWVVDTQMSEAQLAATNVGMPLGIVNDLAVGIHGESADAWAMHDVFAQGMHVGAPADAYNQLGQDWGQPPWRPDRLADLGYAPFRTMVSGILRHSGGLRVDHIMGMFRLWWVPEGGVPADGTYVRYDHDAMVGILALEAHRSGAVVVGEDLGTVEPWVREYLRRRGILGTSILWFEEDESGQPLLPEQWREYCMGSVTTHDLPPTAGYLAGDHVRLRDELGLLTQSVDDALAEARIEQEAWLRTLKERGLLGEEVTSVADHVEEVVVALHRYLLQTPARLRCVNLVDAVGDRRTQNQPGTSNEYPNWRIPLADADGTNLFLEDVWTSERADRLATVMNGWEG